jgi:tyrosine-protein kinase Etk/Wzc
VTVEMQLHLIKYVEEFIHNPANQKALIPNLGLTDVGLVSVIQQYNSLIMAHDRIADGSSEENPALKTLNQQIQSALKSIQVSIANSRKGLQISNTDINTQNTDALSKINSIPRKEREFIEIKRQQQVKETLYLFLLQKREEASLNMAVTVPKGRVLNTPDEAVRTGLQTAFLLLIFALLGLVIPIFIIFIKELINTSIMSRAQVENLTKVPVLAELGHNNTDEIIINHRSVDSNAELFRLLRTKLQFTLDFPTQKVIMITSTEPGEGKTYVSLNLAINLSLTDKKVLLIGLDLRKPQLTKYFELSGKEGISSYLSGHENNYKKLIHTLTEYPLLDVLPAGIIPPNPNELIMNKRLDSLIEDVKEIYDYIVIDTAPVGAVSDTYLIDRLADITLYVCRAGYSDKRNLEFLNHIIADGNLSRAYLIINDLDMSSRNYYYHRGYSYGYGNYYGHEKAK